MRQVSQYQTNRLFIGCAVLLLSGCLGSAERSEKVSNNDFDVEVLFTDSDGYTVKRFRDGEQLRYYVTPGPAEAMGLGSGKHPPDLGIKTLP